MPLDPEHEVIRLIARQRCFYLFMALLLVLMSVPFLENTPRGLMTLNGVNALVLIAGLVAVARSPICLVSGALLAIPTVGFQIWSLAGGDEHHLMLSRIFGSLFYLVTVVYLVGYVLRRETFTLDKLYGAAAIFLMFGVLWSYWYAIASTVYPGALAAGGAPLMSLRVSDLLYFSFTVLTSTGFGDITPVHPVARMLCVLEQLLGVLFLAILIARLSGIYPPPPER